MLASLRAFSKDRVAQQRLKIMKFYYEYGEKATIEAFGADRKVVSRWNRRLKKHNGRLESLKCTPCQGPIIGDFKVTFSPPFLIVC